MKRLAFAMGVLALGFAATVPARADFAVVKFKDTGYCRAWYDHTAKSWGTTQVLWVKVTIGTHPRAKAATRWRTSGAKAGTSKPTHTC